MLTDTYWFDRDIFFTNRRILWFRRSPEEIRYDEISKIGKTEPPSGGMKGVKAEKRASRSDLVSGERLSKNVPPPRIARCRERTIYPRPNASRQPI
jgi:hypothetical protein